jgi:predicted transcriptional regulator
MNLTEFGTAVRKGRIEGRVTLKEMADELDVSPAYLSGLEVGRKKVPADWVKKIEQFFRRRKVAVDNLQALADISNKSIPLDGLKPHEQVLLAGFARRSLTNEQIKKFAQLLEKAKRG